MSFYITKMNETFLSIAQKAHFGFPWSLGETLRKLNPQAKFESNSFFNSSLQAYQAIIIPERFPIEMRVPNLNELHTLRLINMMSLETRKKLSILLDQGIDINMLRAMYDATHIREFKKKWTPPESVRVSISAGVDVTSKAAEKFLNAVKIMNIKLEGYLKTTKGPVRQAYVEKVLKPAYKQMIEAYREYACIRYKSNPPFESLKKLKTATWSVGAFQLNEHTKVISIEKTLSKLKFISKGLLVFEIGLSITNVFEAYLDNKDWMEELAGEVGNLAGGMLGATVGEFVGLSALELFEASFLMLTPVGWCIVVASSALFAVLWGKRFKAIAIEIYRTLEKSETFKTYEKNKAYEIQQSINKAMAPVLSIDDAFGRTTF